MFSWVAESRGEKTLDLLEQEACYLLCKSFSNKHLLIICLGSGELI